MEPTRRSPTHVVARDRIKQQLVTWRAEHPGWNVELQIPLDTGLPTWSLLMTHCFSDRATWYSRRPLRDTFITYLASTAEIAALHTVHEILLMMQREIGVMHSGASAE